MLNPQGIRGPWKAGIVLDWHTVGSQVIGQNEFGHPIFETQRTEIGELLFKFKYRSDEAALDGLVTLALGFFRGRAQPKLDLVLPMPPSSAGRTVTKRIAEGLSRGLSVPCSDSALVKVKSTPELKSVSDPEVRKQMLEGAFRVDSAQIDGKSILLVDDLYRSGATLETAAEALAAQARPAAIYVLAITRTRVNR